MAFPQKIIVISNFTSGWLTPLDFKAFREKAEAQGTTIIVTAQEDLIRQDTSGLLPVDLTKLEGSTATSSSVMNQITKDVDFGTVTEHFAATPHNDSIVLASALDGSPMIALHEAGMGKIFYYGIMDDKSDFKFSPSYPIFWNKIVDFAIGAQDINNFNHRTGTVLQLPTEQWVKTPSGNAKGTRILMDEAGLFDVGGVYHTANLLSDRESDINRKQDAIKTKSAERYTPEKVTKKKEVSFENYLVFAAVVLLVLELLYIKMRGDL